MPPVTICREIEGLNGITRPQLAAALWRTPADGQEESETVWTNVRVARGLFALLKFRRRSGSGLIGHTSHFRQGNAVGGATLSLQPDEPPQDSVREWKRQKSSGGQRSRHGSRSAGCFFKTSSGEPGGTATLIDDLVMKEPRPRGGAVVFGPNTRNFIVTEAQMRGA